MGRLLENILQMFAQKKPPTASENKQHLKFVILGRSGAGKTTFINSVVNQFYGLAYDDERVVAISQEQTLRDPETGREVKIYLKSNIEQFKNKQSDVGGAQTVSQTSKPNIYDLENSKFKLTLIDTPGLGDTGGMETDKLHCKNICNAVASLSDFNAIVLVHKANDCRKDVLLAYLITEFKSMLPRGCEDNFLICFTSAVNKIKIDAIPVIKEMGLPCTKDNHFAFENDSLTPPLEVLKVYRIEYPWKNDEEQQKAWRILKFGFQYWDENQVEFKNLLPKSLMLIPLPGKSFVEISNKKDIVIKLVQRYSDHLIVLQDESKRSQTQLQQLQEIKDKMDANKDYLTSGIRQIPKQRTVKVKNFVDTLLEGNQKTTQCMTCKHLCHERCLLDQIYSQGHLQLKHCLAFGGNPTCIFCRHDFSVHSHTRTVRLEVEEEVTEEYFEEEIYEVTDSNKELLYKEAQADKAKIEAEIDVLNQKTSQKDLEIKSAYRTIAFLHKQLKDTTICSYNEYFLKYIEHRKLTTERNTALSAEEIARELAQLAQAEKDYLAIKSIFDTNPTAFLTEADRQMMDAEYRAIEVEQEKVIESYRGDRSAHHEAQVSRKKSVIFKSLYDSILGYLSNFD